MTWDSGSPSSAALRYSPALRMMERAKLRCSGGRNIHAAPHIRHALANLAPHNVDLPAAAMWSSSMPAHPPITSASPITWKPYLRIDETTRQRDAHSASDSGTSQATCCLHRSSALQGLLLRRETQSASTKATGTREHENPVGNGSNLFQRPVRPLIRRGSTCKDGSMLLQTAEQSNGETHHDSTPAQSPQPAAAP
jgi:hypothetical protein